LKGNTSLEEVTEEKPF